MFAQIPFLLRIEQFFTDLALKIISTFTEIPLLLRIRQFLIEFELADPFVHPKWFLEDVLLLSTWFAEDYLLCSPYFWAALHSLVICVLIYAIIRAQESCLGHIARVRLANHPPPARASPE